MRATDTLISLTPLACSFFVHVMTYAISPHPALDLKLSTMPARLAADWELWLHSSCECGASSVSGLRLLLEKRPDIAHCRVKDIAERLRCKSCTKPFEEVALSDGARTGPYAPNWQLWLIKKPERDWVLADPPPNNVSRL